MEMLPLKEAVVYGKFKEIENLVKSTLNQGISPQVILDEALIPGMDEVGKKFSEGEIYIPEMMVAARVMHKALDLLKPLFVGEKIRTRGKFAIGTVKEDLHDIGKNIVISMMEGAGFEVVDLGVNCPPEQFIQAIEEGAQLVGISAILTTVLHNIGKTIQAIEKKGIRDNVKILVGGAAVTPSIVEEMGGDAYCEDAGEGIIKAKALLS